MNAEDFSHGYMPPFFLKTKNLHSIIYLDTSYFETCYSHISMKCLFQMYRNVESLNGQSITSVVYTAAVHGII